MSSPNITDSYDVYYDFEEIHEDLCESPEPYKTYDEDMQEFEDAENEIFVCNVLSIDHEDDFEYEYDHE